MWPSARAQIHHCLAQVCPSRALHHLGVWATALRGRSEACKPRHWGADVRQSAERVRLGRGGCRVRGGGVVAWTSPLGETGARTLPHLNEALHFFRNNRVQVRRKRSLPCRGCACYWYIRLQIVYGAASCISVCASLAPHLGKSRDLSALHLTPKYCIILGCMGHRVAWQVRGL